MVLLELGFAEPRFTVYLSKLRFSYVAEFAWGKTSSCRSLIRIQSPGISAEEKLLGRRVDAVPLAPDHQGQILAPLSMSMKINRSA